MGYKSKKPIITRKQKLLDRFLYIVLSGLLMQSMDVMGGTRTAIDPLNPTAFFNASNPNTATYLNNMGGFLNADNKGPNLGNEVPPEVVNAYFRGLLRLRNIPRIPSNPNQVNPVQLQELNSVLNDLSAMERAQFDILSFFGANYQKLNAVLDRLSYAAGRQRPMFSVNPVVAAFGFTGVGANGNMMGAADPVTAKQALLELSTTTNKTLFSMPKPELKRYQNLLSSIMTSPVPPVGIDLNDAKTQFLRVQRALAGDERLKYSTDYTVAADDDRKLNANLQQIQAVVNRWNIGPSALDKITSLGASMETDRRSLLSAKQIIGVPDWLMKQIDLALAQMDAVQLRALNTEVEAVNLAEQLSIFAKNVAAKAQRMSAPASKVDVTWIVTKISAYEDLITKVKARLELKDVNTDLQVVLRTLVKRAEENLQKLETFKPKFVEASTPSKRIDFALQAEIERIYNMLSKVVDPVNLLRDPRALPNYEATLKKALSKPLDLPTGITIIQLRDYLKDVRKAQAILAHVELKKFLVKIKGLLNDMAAAGVSMRDFERSDKPGVSQMFADDHDNGLQETEEDKLPALFETAQEEARKVTQKLNEAKRTYGDNSPEVKVIQEELKQAHAKLGALAKANNDRNAKLKQWGNAMAKPSTADDKAKLSAKEKQKIEKELKGVMDALMPVVNAALNGAFALGNNFGNQEINQDKAIDTIQQVFKGLVDLDYPETVPLNKMVTNNAAVAYKRLQQVVTKVDAGTQNIDASAAAPEMKAIKLALIYGVGEAELRSLYYRINSILLEHMAKGELANLTKEKMSSVTPAYMLSALDRLEYLVNVEETQGAGRSKAETILSDITDTLNTVNR